MTQATASPIKASFRPRASPHRNWSRLRQMTSQLRPNTYASAARLPVSGEKHQAIGRPGYYDPGRAQSELPVLDREPSRRRLELDAEMLGERRLVVAEVQTSQVLVERGVHPVQPALIPWLDRE